MQTDAQENKLQEKDGEVLRLLNQIATDMIRKSDVDRLVEEAVAKATAALKADYEERMKAMAAEYETKIAELQNQKSGKGDDKDHTPGKSSKNARKKGNSIICSTKEEAIQRLQEEMNKAAIMQDHLRTRYFWGMRTPMTNLVYFIYDKGSRSREVILKFLKEFFGTIQTDGASMYKIFEKDPTLHITRLSCLVHIRRYFIKSMKFEDETGIAQRFLERIRIIYKFEKSFKKLSDEERQKERATNVIPILNDMYNDLLYYSKQAAGKCGDLLLKAINYAMAEWKGLIRYTMDGRYRADNNYAEQCMRDLACGRKNFLFCGSDNAAMNLSFAYSLTESCKYNNINPYDYWSDLIENVGKEGVDLNSFVHNLWQKHNK